MRRTTLLCILSVVLILVFTACVGNHVSESLDYQKAFDEANTLLEDGEYDAAIKAFESIEIYSEIQAKISEAEMLKGESYNSFLYTTWRDLYNEKEFSYTFNENGTVYFKWGDTEYICSYRVEDGQITVIDNQNSLVLSHFTLEEIDGQKHLRGNMQKTELDCVMEEDYDALKPIEIEITLENWSEYFEIRPWQDIGENGTITNAGYGIFMKDNIQSRYIRSENSIYYYDGCRFGILATVKYVETNENHVAQENAEIIEVRQEELSAALQDLSKYEEESDKTHEYWGHIVAVFSGHEYDYNDEYWRLESPKIYYGFIQPDIEVTFATGTLILYP